MTSGIIVLVFLVTFGLFLSEAESVNWEADSLISEIEPIIYDDDYIIDKFVGGLERPAAMTFVGDDILVIEKDTGKVFLIKYNGTFHKQPVLDVPVIFKYESGLLGIASLSDHVFLYFTESLSGAIVAPNDYIKSQSGYADYYDGFGWYGTFEQLNPRQGYLLDASSSGTLTYAEEDDAFSEEDENDLNRSKTEDPIPHWEFDFREFEYSGSATIALDLHNFDIQENDQIGAFLNSECRGVSIAKTCPINDKIIFGSTLMKVKNDYTSVEKELSDARLTVSSDTTIDLENQINSGTYTFSEFQESINTAEYSYQLAEKGWSGSKPQDNIVLTSDFSHTFDDGLFKVKYGFAFSMLNQNIWNPALTFENLDQLGAETAEDSVDGQFNGADIPEIVNNLDKFDQNNIDIRASSEAINDKMLENLKNF